MHAEERLQEERADLQDSRLITSHLQTRLHDLELRQRERSHTSSDQAAKELVQRLQKRKSTYGREVKGLVRAFNAFLDDHLAAMLAAEEVGGPVVGDLAEVDEADLQAGFSQGRARKHASTVADSRRQQRIDDIWGPEEDEPPEGGRPRTEKDAAGAEMRALTEELLNASASADGTGSATYVLLQRDSAAVRFLVRAKVAQFHPKDARRIRLIDFGRELDD